MGYLEEACPGADCKIEFMPMKKLLNWLLAPDTADRITRILKAWRLWVVGAVLGALVAWGVYALYPPPYRAQAIVVVDQNLEEVWVFPTDRHSFHYLRRETEKLEQLAWSDETLADVVEEVGGTSIEELRQEKLMLSEPEDGPWLFWAEDADLERAEAVVSAWVTAFEEGVSEGIAPWPELEAARADLSAFLLENPEVTEEELFPYLEKIDELADQTTAISPYIAVFISQDEELPVTRVVNQSVYLVSGSVIGTISLVLLALFASRPEKAQSP